MSTPLPSLPPPDVPRYRAAILGSGPMVRRMAQLCAGPCQLVAAVCPASDLPPDASGRPLPGYPDLPSLLAAQPEVNVILAPGLDADKSVQLAAGLPAAMVLVTGPTAEFVLEMAEAGRFCATDALHLARHTRDLLHTAIDEVSEDILLLDKTGRIVDCNRNVYQHRHKTKADFVGFLVWEALDEEENLCKTPDSDCPLSRTLRTGKPSEAMYTRVDEEGRLRYYRVYTYPIFDTNGDLTHVAEMRRDISQRTSMEQRLQQAERLAAIGELSLYIAHEIRNPLFAISGFANTLLRNPSLDDKAREKVSIILQESARLDGILKSILNFTRPTTAQAGQVDVNKVAAETMEVMRFPCESQKVEVCLELAPDLALARGDTDLLKQCVINLVKNAMEAMEDGGRLTLRTGMDWDHVFLQVEDTGVGIAAENLEKVFNPFFSTKGRGAGMGLAMIKKILAELGGEVRLESRQGQGTRVSLFLPPLADDSEQRSIARAPEPPPPPTFVSG